MTGGVFGYMARSLDALRIERRARGPTLKASRAKANGSRSRPDRAFCQECGGLLVVLEKRGNRRRFECLRCERRVTHFSERLPTFA